MPHNPIRMCVICKQRFAKVDLLRHIITIDNIITFDTQKVLNGRGYYVCNKETCREKFFHYKKGKRRKGVKSDKG